MHKVIGRTLGVGISFSVFVLGLWSVNNTGEPWVLAGGTVTTIVGAVMIGIVATQVGKDMDQWGKK